MRRVLLSQVLLLLAGTTLCSAQSKPMFQYNQQRFELAHGYAFYLKMADSQDPAATGSPAEMKWKQSLAVALSDQPFDIAALEQTDPMSGLAQMGKAGALVVLAVPGADGKVELMRIGLPRSDRIVQPDPSTATLRLEAPANGKVRGRLLVWANEKLHKADPKKVPLIAGDVTFEAVLRQEQAQGQ